MKHEKSNFSNSKFEFIGDKALKIYCFSIITRGVITC